MCYDKKEYSYKRGSLMALYITAGVILVLVLLLLLFSWKKVPQDKALIVTGLNKRVITGGGGLVIPFLERADKISLENMAIDAEVKDSLCSTGVPLNVTGTIIVKIKRDTESICFAMEQFNTGNLQSTIKNVKLTVQGVMEGKLREILSTLTVEEIYQNREMLTSKVQEVAYEDLKAMGLEIMTFTIRDISDENLYLESLGAKQIEEVKREAAIARAEAARDIAIKEAETVRLSKQEELKAETLIAEAQRDKALKENAYRQEEETAKAKADAAYSIEQNLRQKEVTEAKMLVEIKKKEMEIDLAHQETLRRTEQLKAEIEKTAEAQKYRVIQEAEAKKAQNIAEAEAAAADIRLKGQAQAEAIRLQGEAEAEAMRLKAESYKHYGEAAMTELIVNQLPHIAAAISKPLAQTEKIVIVDQGGDGGASKVPGYVSEIMAKVPETVEALTGKNILDIFEKSLLKTNSVNTHVHVEPEKNEESTEEV